MSEALPGFEGLGVPGEPSGQPVEPPLGIEPVVGIADDVLHPGATGVRRPRAMRVSVPAGTPVILLVSTGRAERPVPPVVMPDLRTAGIESATRKAAKLGLVLQASPTYAPGVASNKVALQYPEPGQKVQPGTTVSVLISNGRKAPKGIVTQLPDLVGTLASDAENTVLALGLRPVIMRTSHPSAHPETVFAQLPNAQAVAKASPLPIGRYVTWAIAAIVATLTLSMIVAMYISSTR
jgi:PASTA domain